MHDPPRQCICMWTKITEGGLSTPPPSHQNLVTAVAQPWLPLKTREITVKKEAGAPPENTGVVSLCVSPLFVVCPRIFSQPVFV